MSQQRSANAVSGKTARACDSCLRRRARWYCAADDAFLCQSCDSSVHSANPLARRHDRVRLKTSSSLSFPPLPPPPADLNSALPAWHQGFKRKARTPRGKRAPVLVVPDLEALSAEDGDDSNTNGISDRDDAELLGEEELLYCVPILDPVLAEFCSPPPALDHEASSSVHEDKKPVMEKIMNLGPDQGFTGFDPTDVELAEFTADVENLLRQELDNGSFCIDGLGLLDESREDEKSQVKMELMGMDAVDAHGRHEANFLANMEMEFSRETLEFNFDCGSPPAAAGGELEVQKVETVEELDCRGPARVGLSLDYEAVISAWSGCGGSPWTDGERPQINPDDCWPDLMGIWGAVGGEARRPYMEMGIGGQLGNGDGEREARVSRYREKRRTRLFSKKIRYEVRKLNAEKRPRMKGRFVKRASFPIAATGVCGGAGGGGGGGFSYI